MATLSNYGNVATQIQTQNIAGSIYNAFHIKNGSEVGTLLSGLTEDGWQNKNDMEILRSLAFPQMLDRRGDIEKPHYGTCQWILNLAQFQSWTSSTSGLLWIKGHPGSGKSTIMSFLYDRLASEFPKNGDVQLNFFFSARGSTLQHTPLGMLRALLNQLFAQDEEVRQRTRLAFAEKSRVYGENWTAWNWQRPELEALLSQAILQSAMKRRVTVFVDALDEAGELAAREITRYLLHLNDRVVKDSRQAKILLACRHYPVSSFVPGIEVWMEQHNSPDIVAFIKSRLFDGLLDDRDNHWQNVTLMLLQRARGIFQWARLVVPMVEKLVLDGEHAPAIEKWLLRVPQELSEVYEQIIRTVIDTRYRRQSAVLFMWICLGQRPLTIGEVYYALASDDANSVSGSTSASNVDHAKHALQQKARIKSLSGGLVETTRINDKSLDQIVQVVHQSVNDYLLEHGLAVVLSLQDSDHAALSIKNDISQRLSVLSQCHKILYRCCINYLAAYRSLVGKIKIHGMKAVIDAEEMARSGWIEWPENMSFQEEKGEHIPTQIGSWMRYVTENLFIHAKMVTNFHEDELKSDVRQLEPFIDEWIRNFRAHGPINLMRPALKSNLLHVAAAFDLKDLAQHLVKTGYKLDARDGEGRTPLYIAASNGNLRVATVLAQASANLTAEVSYNSLQSPPASTPTTALKAAVAFNHEDFVAWLLSQGVDVNESTKDAESALMIAIRHGYLRLVCLLLDHGANVNQFSGPSFGCALHAASYFGDIDLIRFLISKGADVNNRGGRYGTALRAAFKKRHMEAMRELVAHGAQSEELGPYDRLLSDLSPAEAMFMENLTADYRLSFKEDFDQYCFVSLAADRLEGGVPDLLAAEASDEAEDTKLQRISIIPCNNISGRSIRNTAKLDMS